MDLHNFDRAQIASLIEQNKRLEKRIEKLEKKESKVLSIVRRTMRDYDSFLYQCFLTGK